MLREWEVIILLFLVSLFDLLNQFLFSSFSSPHPFLGSTVEAMASAVEGSGVVIICMSKMYQVPL